MMEAFPPQTAENPVIIPPNIKTGGGDVTYLADRLRGLPPYLFARIDEMKREALGRGVDLIDLSIGDPDIPTPEHVVEAMRKAVGDPGHHRYPSSEGMPRFREAVAGWYERRFGVTLDPGGEVISLMGSKDGVGHMPFAFVNPGDVVLVPTPGYPVYSIGTLFADGESYFMPLYEANGFLPDFSLIPEDVLRRTKLMWLNYPNNPTAAVAGKGLFEEAVELARKFDIIICHDAAYSEIYFDGERPMSFLEVDGAKDVGVELHSLSKTFSMTGWRIGHAVGNREIISGLLKVKSNLDSGMFQAVQEASIAALGSEEKVLAGLRETYQGRRDALYEGLKSAGYGVLKPKATFYLWASVPGGGDSTGFAARLLDEAGVLVTPGNGFGDPGEGYVRFALTVGVERINEAVERIRKI
jgi:LL-diaminopimelate aminotransferase